jgi:cytosine/adenosine deaminase-related metal-dependent hydrolase
VIVGPCRILSGGPAPRILEQGGVRVVGAHVAQIGSMAALAASHGGESMWPGRGRMLVPGIVNGHAHLARHLARGLRLSGARDWERYDRALAPEDVYWAALAALVEGVRHGVTTVCDLHRSGSCLDLSLSEVAAAAAKLGARVATAYAMAEEDAPEERRAALGESLGLARDLERRREGRLRALPGLRAATLAGLGELIETVAAAGGVGLGAHAELLLDATPAERWRAPRERGPLLWAHAERAPAALLAEARERGDALSVSGPCAPALALDSAWGSDAGVNAPPLVERSGVEAPGALARLAGEPALAHYRRVHVNGARWAARWFGEGLGKVEPGAPADLVLLDYHPATELSSRTLPAHLASGIARAPVSGVMVAGQVVMDEGAIVTVDEREVAARARECARRVWGRLA